MVLFGAALKCNAFSNLIPITLCFPIIISILLGFQLKYRRSSDYHYSCRRLVVE